MCPLTFQYIDFKSGLITARNGAAHPPALDYTIADGPSGDGLLGRVIYHVFFEVVTLHLEDVPKLSPTVEYSPENSSCMEKC